MTITGGTQVGGPSAGTGCDLPEELLYDSERTRVTRIRLPDRAGTAVVRKEPLGPGAAQRLRHELAMLERLAGVEGIPGLAPDSGHAAAIMLVDTAGTALATVISAAPLEPAEVVPLALDLAGVVARMHRRGVVHKDINPANIVLAGHPRRPMLIDFDLATTFAEERPGFTHHHKIAGTLAYLAPEQTGRTGRPVDQRADLYALGATLYELATGRPPFGTGDPLRLTHDHLARVPTAPAELNPDVPQVLSDIILRLLEKEPDRRYQSAEGLAHDLTLLAECPGASFPLGERDFPLRLSPPSRLVGRDAETAALGTAFDEAVAGRGRGVLVSGVPGVGKTALIDELRSVVAARGGWFVTGKFDQYRRDVDTDAVRQAFRALGRMLLAEPEEELAVLRESIRHRLGPNTALIGLVPEFALLLGVAPETVTGDPRTAQARLQRIGLEVLQAVASPQRPVVMVVDDLQWAGPIPLGFVDAVLVDADLSGLLLVGAYREAEVDAAHPLTTLLSRWRDLDMAPDHVRLRNLPSAELGTLLGEMLRLPAVEATRLAEAVGSRTGGNPYDTVEMINGLRRDGALLLGPDGWTWDAGTLRGYLGRGDVVDLLSARIGTLPAPTLALLEVLACLGGEVQLDLLQAASDLPAIAVEERLLPSLEDGLLVREQNGDDSVRFRHDRVQQAAYTRLDPQARRELHRTLGHRLAPRPGLGVVAAEQYLLAVDAITEPGECREVAVLLREAAVQHRLLNPTMAERLLAAALSLVATSGAGADDPLIAAVETELHAVLYGLGRHAEADEVYRSIERRHPGPLEQVDTACVQVNSLAIRNRPREAVALGLDMLRRLGVAVPGSEQVGAEVERGLDALYRWVAGGSEADDLRRPEVTDPTMCAVGRLINRMMPPACWSDQEIMAWLVVESGRIWAEHGPAAALVGPLSHATHVTIPLSGDYRNGERVMRRVLAVAEARGYEPETGQARFLYALAAAAWFEPLESGVRQAHRAREGLVHGGDLQNACSTFHASLPQLLDCAPTLDALLGEVESALALATRTGNNHAAAGELPYQQLVRALRGETYALGSFTDPSFDEAAYPDVLAANPPSDAMFHAPRALAAAIFGHSAELARHAAAAMALTPLIPALYPTASAHLLQALALAERARHEAPADRAATLAELDACRGWLVARAADAPGNFLHLLRLVEAERAWAVGGFRAAAEAFDAAMQEVTSRHRPWHQALITERAALFHLAYGLEHIGRTLLGQARHWYRAWGATAKVREMDRQYPFLPAQASAPTGQNVAEPQHSATFSTDTIDLLSILRASQALSSETNLDRLRNRVVEVLGAMAGATTVWVLLHGDDGQDWVLPAPTGATGTDSAATISVEEAGAAGLLPLSAFRYAERTREPLLVEDATRDDRFTRDPYLAGLACCSLLVVPILIRGALHAVVLLENRLSRGAFTADRLDGVMLIAGQLAVSFDNALVYASLERKVAERTDALAESNTRLELLSVTDPLTGLANRRRLADVLDHEWRRAVQHASSVAVLMIDIDHFKLYNDNYGHAAGDECLRRVADVLRDQVRDTDLVARYGGEEFAVILPGAEAPAASRVARRILATVAALNEPHELAASGMVTVSIGVAAVVACEEGTAQAVIEAADAELYVAKRNGRNQVAGSTPG